MKNWKNFIQATSILIGTIVGAGIFGLPYVFASSGLIPGIFLLLFLGVIFLLVKFCYAEVILRTDEEMEMSGYIGKYLGKKWQFLITLSLSFGLLSSLVAYIIGSGQFLSAIFTPFLGGSEILWSLAFWAVASILLFKGISIISKLELFMAFTLILVVALIFGFSYSFISVQNLTAFSWSNILFPYGAILFALGGATALPTMRRLLKDDVPSFRKAIVLGITVPVLIYIIFGISVVGVTGIFTTEMAMIGVVKETGMGIIGLIGYFFGFLAISTSFLALGHILIEFFHRDYRFPRFLSWALACFTPLFIFLLGVRSFVAVISFSGGILSGIQGIALVVCYYRAKKKGLRTPEFKFSLPQVVAYLIYLVFFLGIIYQVFYY
ncbi:GerAB/ArcD/ProY family transporter [Patescibacteria group bacterium]|nr:GerAB/ArcD/ProY family transporter [Patescibacteria group bacterium]